MKAANFPLQPILRQGSEGAGISIDCGVTTTVSLFDSHVFDFQILINGEQTIDTEVSELVLMQYLNMIKKPCFVKIEHQIDIPIGFGLGTSGAGALSLSYALNKCFGLGLSTLQAAQIAHYVEVLCGTGLGTVLGEYAGGFEYRPLAGAPGLGVIRKIKLEGYRAVILCRSPICTKKVLHENQDFRRSWREDGISTPLEITNLKDFLDISYAFVSDRELVDRKSMEIISKLSSHGITSSIALFGKTIFTVVPKHKTHLVEGCLSEYQGHLITCGIDTIGARLL
jgi:pantoate kinase